MKASHPSKRWAPRPLFSRILAAVPSPDMQPSRGPLRCLLHCCLLPHARPKLVTYLGSATSTSAACHLLYARNTAAVSAADGATCE
eukprot:scaffold2083_cov419-Prasinococcus_capsulatus_cf.AAC.13